MGGARPMVLVRPSESRGRRRALWALVPVLCLVGAGAWWWAGHPIAGLPEPPGRAGETIAETSTTAGTGSSRGPAAHMGAGTVARGAATFTLADAPPSQMREALRAAYRLQPDRRCTLAFGEVYAWITGDPAPPVSTRFDRGVWNVLVGDRQAARLPELPDYDDCTRLLVSWAQLLQGAPTELRPASAPDPRSAAISAPAVLAALDAADTKATAPLDPALLASSARNLVLLSLQTLDLLEIADVIPARAWAFLAMARARSGADLRRESALLAEDLGYSESARRIAAELDDADPARAYVLRDDAALRRAAKRLPDDELARMLLLLRLGSNGDYPGWLEAVRRDHARDPYAVPVLISGLELNAFVANRFYADVMPYLILMLLFRETADPAWVAQVDLIEVYAGVPGAVGALAAALGEKMNVTSADLVRDFEKMLDQAAAKRRGPLLDASLQRAYFDALFYSALYRAAIFRLDQLSSIPATDELVESFAGSSSPRAVAFVTWLGHLVEAKRGSGAVPVLLEDLDDPAPLGAAPRKRSFEALSEYVFAGKPMRTQATRRLASRLDSRPEHAVWLAAESFESLRDLNLSEELFEYVVRTSATQQPNAVVWHAAFTGDGPRLESALRDPVVPASAKQDIVKRLAAVYGSTDPRIEQLYRVLLRESPDSFALTQALTEHLEGRKQYAKARQAWNDWLARDVPDSGLQRVLAQSRIARAHYLQGDYRSAWRVVAPLVETQQAGAMERGALTLAKLGRKPDADQLFRRVVDRYPDLLRVRLSYASFLWENDRNEAAAGLLRDASRSINAETWNDEVAKSFAAAFAGRPDHEALSAFEALEDAGLPHVHLSYLARPLRREGRYELAFKMGEGLRDPTLAQAEILTEAYASLKRWRGPEQATSWLRARIPPAQRNPASMVFYAHGDPDPLWDVIEDPERGTHPEWVWLVRALTEVRSPSEHPGRRRALDDYFATARPDDVHVIARYLLGSGDEDAVWERARDPRTRVEAAYFVGLKSLCAGDARAASDWFRVVQELAAENMGEYHWSGDQLWRWQKEARSLDRLRPTCTTATPT